MTSPEAAAWWSVVIAALAAAATICAVLVALRTSRQAGDIAIQLRRDERKVELAREQAQRRQLSLAFDQELYMMIGQFQFLEAKLHEAQDAKHTDLAMGAITQCMPTSGFALLERFASDFHIFPTEQGANLLGILGSWIAVKQAPPMSFSDEDQLWAAVAHIRTTATTLIQQMETSRHELRAFIPHNIQLPPLGDYAPMDLTS